MKAKKKEGEKKEDEKKEDEKNYEVDLFVAKTMMIFREPAKTFAKFLFQLMQRRNQAINQKNLCFNYCSRRENNQKQKQFSQKMLLQRSHIFIHYILHVGCSTPGQ